MTPEDIAKLINEDLNVPEMPDTLDPTNSPEPEASERDLPDSEPLDIGAEEEIEDPEVLRKQKEAADAKAKAADEKAKAAQEYAELARGINSELKNKEQASQMVNHDQAVRQDKTGVLAHSLTTLDLINKEIREKGTGAANRNGLSLWQCANQLKDVLLGTKYEAQATMNGVPTESAIKKIAREKKKKLKENVDTPKPQEKSPIVTKHDQRRNSEWSIASRHAYALGKPNPEKPIPCPCKQCEIERQSGKSINESLDNVNHDTICDICGHKFGHHDNSGGSRRAWPEKCVGIPSFNGKRWYYKFNGSRYVEIPPGGLAR